jgi:hypothetical protein
VAFADAPAERRVLLSAGVRAAVRMAAQKPDQSEAVIEPCPAETERACSPRAARVIGDMLHGAHADLLPEALDLLRSSGQRLPHSLLVDALRIRDPRTTALMRDVIGQRGLWLARQNPAWASGAYGSRVSSLDEAERVWAEGTAPQRREALRTARALDPARARGWLEQTWPKEKADQRASFLEVLCEGLSTEDEGFLEAALQDRSSTVRETVQSILPHLASSGFVRRMIARADAMLSHKRSMLALLKKPGTLEVKPPESVDDAADRDGLLAKPPPGTGARAYWLSRALSVVPPAHWETRFDARPEELVSLASGSDWAVAVCEGWTNALTLHGGPGWAPPLWEFWQTCNAKLVADTTAAGKLIELLAHMNAADAATQIASLLDEAPRRLVLSSALAALPSPWPAAVGCIFLAALRRHLPAATARAPELIRSLSIAARALPRVCCAQALIPIELAGAGDRGWDRALADFTEIIAVRHTLAQEIAP